MDTSLPSGPPFAPPAPAATRSGSRRLRALARLPEQPCDYARLTRGPARAWWRLPLSLLLLTVIAGSGVFAMTWIAVRLGIRLDDDAGPAPAALLVVNLSLTAGIVAVLVSLRWAHQIPAGYAHSVTGRFRWRWAGGLALCLAPVPVVMITVTTLLSGEPHWQLDPQLGWYLLVVITTTGLQCAGEEYVFRGWLLQNLGGLFRRAPLAWGVPTVLSAVLFALAHGSLHPWVLLDLGLFAVAAAVLTWRTGGIEGAVVMHTLHNVVTTVLALLTGGLAQAFVSGDTTGSGLNVLLWGAEDALMLAGAFAYARRRRPQRLFTPTSPRSPG